MDPQVLNAVITGISFDRFATYRAAAKDDARALHLYQWNIACSSSLYGPLQVLEVRLRNALHEAAMSHFRQTDWWNCPKLKLTEVHQRMLVNAYQATRRGGYLATPSRIVSELPFGFWVGLLGKGTGYEMSLWRPALRHAFPTYKGTCSQIHQDIDRLRALRNRIAHHEPIFQRHIQADYGKAVCIIEMLCPSTAAWVISRSRLSEVLGAKPTTNSRRGPMF